MAGAIRFLAASTGSTSNADPLVWESFLWGLLSASSLNIGSLIGVTCLPSKKVRAMLMAFGGGALLFALSVELFGHVLHKYEENKETAAVFVMESSAVAGGILFAGLNRLLNSQGADVRKFATTKGRLARMRALMMRRLTSRLHKVHLFSMLTYDELIELVQNAMFKERFNVGDIIMDEKQEAGIYFIISGLVRVQLFDKDAITARGLELQDLRTTASDDTDSRSSHHIHTWDLGPNQIFGDMTVLTGVHMSARVEALKLTKVLVLPRHEVAQLLVKNSHVKDQVSLRAVERLRQVKELRHMPNHALASLSARCSHAKFQPGEKLFSGTVNHETPLICVVLGSVERTFHEGFPKKTVLHASCLLCTEHLKGKGSRPFTLVAVGQTSALFLQRSDLGEALAMSPKRDFTRHFSKETRTAWQDPELPTASVDEAEPESTPPPEPETCSRPVSNRRFSDILEEDELSEGQLMTFCHDLGWDGDDPDQVDRQGSKRLRKSDTLDQVSDADLFDGPEVGHKKSTLSYGQNSPMGVLNGVVRRMSETNSLSDRDLSMKPDDMPNAIIRSPFRTSSKSKSQPQPPLMSLTLNVPTPPSKEEDKQLEAMENGAERTDSKLVSRVSSHDDHIQADITMQESSMHAKEGNAAVMVWLGILIDAVPESLVIGILVNKAAAQGDNAASVALPFVISVFLSNLPEAMSSSGSMKSHGMSVSNIMLMWLATTVVTAAGALIGAVVFPPERISNKDTELVVSAVEGLAAGAMLTMIAQTMMPEAFEQGGDVVGLSCLAGFLCSMSVKLIPT